MTNIEQLEQFPNPLTKFFSDMSETDQATIDNDVLNRHGLPLSQLDLITDHETARHLIMEMKKYISLKQTAGTSKKDIETAAENLFEELDRKIDENLG